MTIIVVVVNTILKMILIILITWISEDTWSQTYKTITNGVFVTLFFNTAFLMLLTNANFNEAGLPGGDIFRGRFYDFNQNWFVDIGYPITQTMLINCFMPFISMTIDKSIPIAMRLIDNSFSRDS